MIKILRHITVLVLLVIVLTVCAKANDTSEKLKLLLRGMDDTHLSLNSGICYVTRSAKDGNNITTNDKCFIAFDYNKNFYRFDVEGHEGSAKTLRTPEYRYSTIKLDREYEAVFRSSVNDMTPHRSFINPFDIRSVGLFTPVGSYWTNEYKKISEGILNRLSNVVEINENKDGVVVFVVQANPKPNSPPPAKSTYFIDTKRGYTIIKYENLMLSRITNSHETSWKKIKNQWVPVSFVLSSNQGISAEWTFDWKSVNEPIPEEYFNINSLSDTTTDLFSTELNGEIIRIGKIEKGIESVTDQSKAKYSYFNYILITAGLIMILIGLAKMGYDRWNRTSQT
jgi:hypothetical protein